MGYRLAAVCTAAVLIGLLNYAFTVRSLEQGAGSTKAVRAASLAANDVRRVVSRAAKGVQSGDFNRAAGALKDSQQLMQTLSDVRGQLPFADAV